MCVSSPPLCPQAVHTCCSRVSRYWRPHVFGAVGCRCLVEDEFVGVDCPLLVVVRRRLGMVSGDEYCGEGGAHGMVSGELGACSPRPALSSPGCVSRSMMCSTHCAASHSSSALRAWAARFASSTRKGTSCARSRLAVAMWLGALGSVVVAFVGPRLQPNDVCRVCVWCSGGPAVSVAWPSCCGGESVKLAGSIVVLPQRQGLLRLVCMRISRSCCCRWCCDVGAWLAWLSCMSSCVTIVRPASAAASPPPHLCQSLTRLTWSMRCTPLRMSSAMVASVGAVWRGGVSGCCSRSPSRSLAASSSSMARLG